MDDYAAGETREGRASVGFRFTQSTIEFETTRLSVFKIGPGTPSVAFPILSPKDSK